MGLSLREKLDAEEPAKFPKPSKNSNIKNKTVGDNQISFDEEFSVEILETEFDRQSDHKDHSSKLKRKRQKTSVLKQKGKPLQNSYIVLPRKNND